MIIRINLDNCNLYVGNISKCIYYENLEGLRIIRGELYKKDVPIVSTLNNAYVTLEDYVRNRANAIKLEPNGVNDLYLDLRSLRRADKELFEDKMVKLKRKK